MARDDYKASVTFTSKDLTGRQKVKLKDAVNYTKLEEATQIEPVEINVDYYALIDIHNEHAKDDKDYQVCVTVDKDGTMYSTGSTSYFNALEGIIEELEDIGDEEDTIIKVFRKPSKNRPGKDFITCTLV